MTVTFYENDENDEIQVVSPITSYTVTGLTTGLNTTTLKVTETMLPANLWMSVLFSNADMGLLFSGDLQAEVGLTSHDLFGRLGDGFVNIVPGNYANGAGEFAANFLFGIKGRLVPEATTLWLLAIGTVPVLLRPRGKR